MNALAAPPHPLHRTLSRPHGYEPLVIEGALPEALSGTLFRAGPGMFERFGKPYAHPFEADGAVTAVRFGRGVAHGASRLVQSAAYREEEEAGKPLYGSPASWFRRVGNAWKGRIKTSGNTSVLHWQGRLFALMEAGLPQEMELSGLGTLDATDLDGVLNTSFSAHPHRIAKRRTTINFGLRYDKKMHVDLFELPDAGPAKKLGSFEAPWMAMLHDFVVTENHAVFVIGPARLVLWRALLGSNDFGKLFEWNPEMGVQVVVVPLADPGAHKRFDLDPFWVWHFGNAYENGSGKIVLDMCRYDDFGSLGAIAAPEKELAPPLLHRMVIDPPSGDVRIEQLWDQFCEFPTIHPDLAGRAHSRLWMLSERPEGQGITRFSLDTLRARTWEAPPGHLVSEPIPVPKTAGTDSAAFHLENAVWVLTLVFDPDRDQSYIAVLDGERPTSGPVAKVWFDQPLPQTFHGAWVRGGATVS
ncbi:MAG: carotenoid oxygenase family protein [Deltaproteobacteria bacterium]|nr:carotenoid oxygenase family protein [Deltaproteobacteria bacterium]